jgi:hypothetical protein
MSEIDGFMHSALVILTMFLSKPAAQSTSSPSASISIQTQDSLSVAKGIYSSIFFTAVPATKPGDELPIQYQLTGSGSPPGMIFEAYPCNKPNKDVCPAVASANGIFLDGVPTAPGSYDVELTATDGASGNKGYAHFTLTIKDSNAR